MPGARSEPVLPVGVARPCVAEPRQPGATEPPLHAVPAGGAAFPVGPLQSRNHLNT